MNKGNLEQLYKEGHLKRGHSPEVDQAIADINQLSTDRLVGVKDPMREKLPPLPSEELTKRWSRFVAVAMSNFPDIEPYNLTAITTLMLAEKRYNEEAFLCQLIEALVPSCESACFLGHAYRHLEEDYLALQCYQEAYRRTASFAEEKQLDAANPAWLDAADYLRYATDCQLRMDLPADALMSLMRSVHLVRKAGECGAFKRQELAELYAAVMEAGGWPPNTALRETPKTEATP